MAKGTIESNKVKVSLLEYFNRNKLISKYMIRIDLKDINGQPIGKSFLIKLGNYITEAINVYKVIVSSIDTIIAHEKEIGRSEIKIGRSEIIDLLYHLDITPKHLGQQPNVFQALGLIGNDTGNDTGNYMNNMGYNRHEEGGYCSGPD